MCDLQLWISQTCAIQVQSRPADGASLLTHVDLAFLKLQGEQSSCGSVDTEVFGTAGSDSVSSRSKVLTQRYI